LFSQVPEVVAGMIDAHEQPEEATKREIHEEIGYLVSNLTPIATFYVSPGGSSERIYLYYTEVCNSDHISAGGGLVSEHEDIELLELSFAALWDMLARGEIHDANSSYHQILSSDTDLDTVVSFRGSLRLLSSSLFAGGASLSQAIAATGR
jgi:nudix-type nucleoside diphosphatase (YffH/AdpP family)